MDPSEWLDDYWMRVKYDNDLIDAANDELNNIAAQQQEINNA